MLHSGKDMALRAELRKDWFKSWQEHRHHCVECSKRRVKDWKGCDFFGVVTMMLKALRDDPR